MHAGIVIHATQAVDRCLVWCGGVCGNARGLPGCLGGLTGEAAGCCSFCCASLDGLGKDMTETGTWKQEEGGEAEHRQYSTVHVLPRYRSERTCSQKFPAKVIRCTWLLIFFAFQCQLLPMGLRYCTESTCGSFWCICMVQLCRQI